LKSDKNKLTLSLPDDLVGIMIEVIAFSVDEVKVPLKKAIVKADGSRELKAKLKEFNFNSGGYKFSRDEANDYE
jgi:hypothetical protein